MVTEDVLDTIAARFAPDPPATVRPALNGGNGHKPETSNDKSFLKRIGPPSGADPDSTDAQEPLAPVEPPEVPPAAQPEPVFAVSTPANSRAGLAGLGPAAAPSFRLLKSHGKDWRVPEEFFQELQSLPDQNSRFRLAGDLADVLIDLARHHEPGLRGPVTEAAPGNPPREFPSALEERENRLWHDLREAILRLVTPSP